MCSAGGRNSNQGCAIWPKSSVIFHLACLILHCRTLHRSTPHHCQKQVNPLKLYILCSHVQSWCAVVVLNFQECALAK